MGRLLYLRAPVTHSSRTRHAPVTHPARTRHDPVTHVGFGSAHLLRGLAHQRSRRAQFVRSVTHLELRHVHLPARLTSPRLGARALCAHRHAPSRTFTHLHAPRILERAPPARFSASKNWGARTLCAPSRTYARGNYARSNYARILCTE